MPTFCKHSVHLRLVPVYMGLTGEWLSNRKRSKICDEISIQFHHWSLGMDKLYHHALCNGCNYISLSLVGLKVIHISKIGPKSFIRLMSCRIISSAIIPIRCMEYSKKAISIPRHPEISSDGTACTGTNMPLPVLWVFFNTRITHISSCEVQYILSWSTNRCSKTWTETPNTVWGSLI